MTTVKQADPLALEVSRKFVKRVRALIPEAVLILYGSAARGEMEELSDIDIYMEIPDSYDIDSIRPQISDIAWEVGFDNDRVIQSIVYQKSEVWDSPLRSSPFIKAVMREGVIL